ncbi:MAG: hypothetical protein ACF8MF_06885 [Phycisphaerales bacterium JB052]
MSSTNLLNEFVTYAAAAARATDARLAGAYGVPLDWLQSGAARYGIASGNTQGQHWQPDPIGRPLLVLPDVPLADPDDERLGAVDIGDLIAFNPHEPTRWWARTGAAVMLNPEGVERGQHHAEPVHVHATPLDWLRAAGAGIVVLDWSGHLPLRLAGPPRLIAADLALAERLDRALNRPAPRHRIEVLARALEAAE